MVITPVSGSATSISIATASTRGRLQANMTMAADSNNSTYISSSDMLDL